MVVLPALRTGHCGGLTLWLLPRVLPPFPQRAVGEGLWMGEAEARAEPAVRLPGQVGLQPCILVTEVVRGSRQGTAVGRHSSQEDGQEEVHG